jgi:hypothetical protein
MSYLPAPTHNLSAISLKTIAAAVVAFVLARSRVFAQTAIQELAAFSFYHPYLDVLNGSAHTPAARLILERRPSCRRMPRGKAASAPWVHCDIDPIGDKTAARP